MNQGSREFNTILLEMRDGGINRMLTEDMAKVVSAVRDTGKPGTISLTLKITPDGDALSIDTNISTKIPKHSMGVSIFYEKDGALYRQDPRQNAFAFSADENVTPITHHKES